jgi:ABC-2 type transport system ATP-binding protein
MTLVRVEGLSKSFAGRRTWGESLRAPWATTTVPVVQGVSFDVAPGEIFGLLGQNGAGKTTIFKMLSTLITPDAGRIAIDGHDAVAAPARVRRLLAPVLANERSLYWRLSAEENLRLFCALQGVPRQHSAAELQRVLAVTGLEDSGSKMVGAFSSGMRQRLLIARALLGRPRILLLDEPTRSLDPISARDFRRFLRDRVVGEEGCTVLLATHDAEEVWELCDRVGVLQRGRLLAVDATNALRHRASRATYELWLRVGDAAAATAALAARELTLRHIGPAGEAGWGEYWLALGGGADEASAIGALLAAAGVAPARFAPREPSLADLIERVVATANAAGNA